MKEGIHPEYKKVKIKCVCGNEIEAGSTEENLKIEICNACHPLFTGQQKIVDNASIVKQFIITVLLLIPCLILPFC